MINVAINDVGPKRLARCVCTVCNREITSMFAAAPDDLESGMLHMACNALTNEMVRTGCTHIARTPPQVN